ncbi:hypothetical protein N0A02_00210 [Paraburkholderia acidicola]|uniref:Uncharacterized protein n=1 Tax=Paraburkholderia acidicola TaxID=1912599 RepID=A0ABV1LGI6_9BURK
MNVDYRYCLSPSLAQPGEASYVLAHLAGRTLWHRMYDNLPSLEKELGGKSTEVLLTFLADCEQQGKSLDWRMYLIFFEWLHQRDLISNANHDSFLLECLGAAAARWAGEIVHVGMYRMVLGCNDTGLVVGIARSTAIDKPAKIYRVSIDASIPTGPRFQFSLSPHADRWSIDNWQAVFPD